MKAKPRKRQQVTITAMDMHRVREYCSTICHIAREAGNSQDPRVTVAALQLLRKAQGDLDRIIERILFLTA